MRSHFKSNLAIFLKKEKVCSSFKFSVVIHIMLEGCGIKMFFLEDGIIKFPLEFEVKAAYPDEVFTVLEF